MGGALDGTSAGKQRGPVADWASAGRVAKEGRAGAGRWPTGIVQTGWPTGRFGSVRGPGVLLRDSGLMRDVPRVAGT